MTSGTRPLDQLFRPAERDGLFRIGRALYPHERLGDGPYLRAVDAIMSEASHTPMLYSLLIAGIRALDDAVDGRLADAAPDELLTHLVAIERTPFFAAVRQRVAWQLYDDHEVWEFIGYPGAAFELGGYLHRGFDDLDWLPAPRVTESTTALVELGPVTAEPISQGHAR